ncbi:MAG TPA: hypothetical protein VF524_02930 [Polyangia bacterium]
MREAEMRRRIDGFLKRRMQGMLAPALGLGLAVAGCGKTTSTPIYSAPNPDGQIGPIGDAAGLTHDVPVYSAPIVPDALMGDAFVTMDTLPTGTDAPDLATASETGSIVDAIPAVDAGTGVDSGADLGNTPTKYMAQLPDGGPDLGMAPIYMAPVYMASLPLG